jgi:4-hydroxythreonine-4-phosphate dehydrogenase
MPGTGPPTLALTCGDPAGIGPEIVLRAASDARIAHTCRLAVLGPLVQLRQVAERHRLPWPFEVVSRLPAPGVDWPQPLLCDLDPAGAPLPFGRATADGGRLAARAVELGTALCQAGTADALVTAPLNKEGLALAGLSDPGHTEMLQRLTGAPRVIMLFWSERLRVALLTTHLSLRDALRRVRRGRIRDTLVLLAAEFRRWFGASPRIAVAGLNPHAGEAGRFGAEEAREIGPAVAEASRAGVQVVGPVSPDTVFRRAAGGEFDLVLALYHDQGTIAVKSLCFGGAVNTTLGLPFPRTSVDHGTAYDIAGTGRADHASLVEAIRLATRLAGRAREPALR